MVEKKTSAGSDGAAGPSEDLIASEYWHESPNGDVVLIAAVCDQCGQHFLPKVAVCSGCSGTNFHKAALSPQGTLYSYTLNHAPSPGFPPVYCVGYVDFPEGVRVFGHVRHDTLVPPRIDGPVGIEVAPLFVRPTGEQVRGYRFVPITSEGGNSQ